MKKKKEPISNMILGYIEGMKLQASRVTEGIPGDRCGPLSYKGHEVNGPGTEPFFKELINQMSKRGFNKKGFKYEKQF